MSGRNFQNLGNDSADTTPHSDLNFCYSYFCSKFTRRNIKNIVSWSTCVASHNVVDRYGRFGGTCCLYLQGRRRKVTSLREVDTGLQNYTFSEPESPKSWYYSDSFELKAARYECRTESHEQLIILLYYIILYYSITYYYIHQTRTAITSTRLYIQPTRKDLTVRHTTNILWEIVTLYCVLHILYFNNSILSGSTIYVILARHEELPEDDVLTSKHVAANHM